MARSRWGTFPATIGTASIGLIIGGALWGVIWIPLRVLDSAGLPGAWAGLIMYGGTCAMLLLLYALRMVPVPRLRRSLLLCGLFTGAAFSLYATSLLLTDVVRAILLFYLVPIWGTLLGIAVLGERLTLVRIVALALAVAGLAIVLGLGVRVPWPSNAGDWMALGSGMCWAIGSLFVYRASDVTVADQVSAFAFGALAVTLLSILLLPSVFWTPVSPSLLLPSFGWGLLLALYVLPMLVLTIWPLGLLTPARAGLLLMSDVVVGVASAAAFAGDPFGPREMLGSTLIITAALVDVLGSRTTVA